MAGRHGQHPGSVLDDRAFYETRLVKHEPVDQDIDLVVPKRAVRIVKVDVQRAGTGSPIEGPESRSETNPPFKLF